MNEAPSFHRTWWWTGRRPGLLLRLAVAGVIVVLSCAAATAVYLDHQVTALAGDLKATPRLHIGRGVLAPTPYGGAETILLVGNDQRQHTTTAPVLPHSNEMLLVRLDPNRRWISMMSLPRELDVPIHTTQYGLVHTRLNASLMFGGIPLLVSTIKQVTGLSVNHVIVIDFDNFKRAVDELHCVYGTIDRRYLHINTPGSEQYQQIDLQPGYQRLCGRAALSFVSYRHGDTSLVRDARDQEFLLAAKQQFGPTLLGHLSQFERIFGQTVQTDDGLRSASGLLSLMGTMVAEQGKPVRQVRFQATLDSFIDTATPAQIAASVRSFMDGADHMPTAGVAGAARFLHRRRAPGVALMRSPASELVAMRAAGRNARFPFLYPRVRAAAAAGGPLQTNGCSGVQEPIVCLRHYEIHAGRRAYPAYVVVTDEGALDQYYDVQGTTWTTAPMFNDPQQFIHVGGRTYALYYSGAHLDVVAWWVRGAVYWVHNTITDALDNRQMLAIAESTTPLGEGAGSAPGDSTASRRGMAAAVAQSSRSVAPPAEITAADGAAGGLMPVLIALAVVLTVLVLAPALLVQRRRTRAARDALEAAGRRRQALVARLAEAEDAASSVSSPRSAS